MAETMQSLDQLGTLKPAAPEAPKYVQKLDKQGRAYATGKRKNAVARVWIKPGSGKITVNTRTGRGVLRAAGAAHADPAAAGRGQPRRPSSTSSARCRAAACPARPARCATASPRRSPTTSRICARAQARRLPHPRLPRGRAQEVRPRQGPPFVPVLQALTQQALVPTVPPLQFRGASAPLFICENVSLFM